MRLCFDRTLYAGSALDQALQAFASVATTVRSETETAFVVELSLRADAAPASAARRLRRIALELGNYALGLTIERGGPDR